VKLQYKGEGAKLENLDAKERVIQVYVSAFNSKDSDGDVIVPGAFTKSISEWGPTAERKGRYWFLKNHDTSQEIAKPFEVKQDSYGLLFSVKMPNTTKANDLFELYDGGHINEHSIGFVTLKNQEKKDYNEITEIKLYEGSAVLWGANENTPTVSVKSIQDLDDEFTRTIKSLRNWKGTEEGYELLELKLMQLKDYAVNLKQPPAQALQEAINPQPEMEKQAADFLKVLEAKLFTHDLNVRLKQTI
jgi:uncharacterized protein